MEDNDDSSFAPPPPAPTSNPLAASTEFGTAAFGLFTATGAIVASIVSLLVAIVSALPFIIGALAITGAMLPWVVYHDRLLEESEFALRTKVYPIYRDTIREVATLIRAVFNPAICWWNALNWWGYGMVRFVLFPTLRECGIGTLASNFGRFLFAVTDEALLIVVTGRFMTEYAQWPQITITGVALADSWINLYTCSCSDLADIVRVVPIINPLIALPPVWGVLVPFSEEWRDPKLWCALENVFNVILAAAREVITLIGQVLRLISGQQLASDPFIRPDVRDVVTFLCQGLECLVRSAENSYQRFWNKFIPFQFMFQDYLSIVDTIVCILLKTIALVFRILVNIDKAVTYPTDPFWEATVKPDVTEILNLIATPTRFDPIAVPELPNAARFQITTYHYDTTLDFTPAGNPNPLFGKRRATEAVCIFITRTICDPSDSQTACYSSSAQNLLMGLDFCCLTTTVLDTATDIIAALFEVSLHLANGPDEAFLYIDAQPFTTHLKDGLVRIVRCILSVFGLIPVVGTCIRDLLTGIVEYLLCMIDFIQRVVIGLVTLPYYIIVLPGIPNFVQNANEALDFFVQIHENLITDTPSSVKNCLVAILNNGFPIPPIPCASCVVGGFVDPPAFKKKRMLFEKDGTINSPVSLAMEIWGSTENDAAFHITPLLRYKNHTTNPFKLASMISVNAQTWTEESLGMLNLRSMNAFMDDKKRRIFERWERVKRCNKQTATASRMQAEDPRLYQYHLKRGDFDCANPAGVKLPMMPPYGESIEHGLDPGKFDPFAALKPNMTEVMQKRLELGPIEPTTTGCSPEPQCFDFACLFRTTLEALVLIIQSIARFFNGLIQGGASLQGTMQDFPYFTGEFCDEGVDKDCFQSDVVGIILALFRPIKCLCQVLNLIIPVTPSGGSGFTQGRPDICCAIQRLSELIACIIQVAFNAIESLAMGNTTDPPFKYFVESQFRMDVSTLFDIMLAVVQCLCFFIEAIFPLNFIPGFADAVDFEICCIPQALLNTAIEIVRGLLQVIITLATISIDEDSFCYWRLDRTTEAMGGVNHACGGSLDRIGIVVQADIIIDSFLPAHGQGGGACFANCANDNGATGIVPCICQLFNTLIPFRRFPNKKTNCDDDINTRNCPETDFCCPFAKAGFFLGDSLKFLNRAIVALWQSWDGGLPEFFIHYIFCSEGTPPRCPPREDLGPDGKPLNPGAPYQNVQVTACAMEANNMIPNCVGTQPVIDNMGMTQFRCGEFTCGKMHIIIKDLTDPYEGLLARCTCQFFGLLDRLLALFFRLIKEGLPFAGWSCCFCGGLTPDGDCKVNGGIECDEITGTCVYVPGGPCILRANQGSSGVLTSLSYVAQAVLVALTDLIRQFPFACYWKPFPRIANIAQTWIFSFLGPTANALCIAVGNLQCFVQSMFLLPQACTYRGQRFLGSVLRWASEVIFRVIGFIEAFVNSFIEEDNTCIGEGCDPAANSKETSYKGIKRDDLGKMMVILLSIPFDALIGDMEVACTTVCPSFFAVPAPATCGCWNNAPSERFGNKASTPPYEWTTDAARCTKANSAGFVEHIGTKFMNTTGCCALLPALAADINVVFENPLPACQSPDERDFQTFGYPEPGSCALLGACRPDALPSCANDPMTPIALSQGYTGAIDGVVMGLLRYLRCILSNIICDPDGSNCQPLGLIFYPAMLIFSLSWQILGGIIRFQVAIVIFFFSLFAPAGGNGCDCYTRVESTYRYLPATMDSPRLEITMEQRYWRVGALCYRCNILGHDCGQLIPVGSALCSFERQCPSYCPINQLLKNPGISEAAAMAACMAEYADGNTTKLQGGILTPTEACTGHLPAIYYEDPIDPTRNCTDGNITLSSPDVGLCNPGRNPGTTCATGSGPFAVDLFFDSGNLVQIDACPDPACQWNSPGYPSCGDANVKGFWKCSKGFFDNEYPANPLNGCGVIEIIQNGIQVFDAFLAIFQTPLLIPPNNGGKKRYSPADFVLTPKRSDFVGPTVRESRQTFARRVREHQHAQRYAGTIYGITTGFPNVMELVTEALYNYDTDDCWNDPVACACRNLEMSAHCTWNADGTISWSQKRNGHPMTTSELTMMMKEEKFTGTSVCDHIIGGCAGMDWNASITLDERNQWINCMDKLVQGERINLLSPIFPMDIMYNPHAMQKLTHNMYDGAKGFLAKRYEAARVAAEKQSRQRVRRQQMEEKQDPDYIEPISKKFPNFRQELYDRMEESQKLLQTHYDIKPHDLMFNAILKADQLYYKYHKGYYGHMLRLAVRNLADGKYSGPTTADALYEMRMAINELSTTIRTQPYREMATKTMEAAGLVSRYVSDVFNEGVIPHVTKQFARYKQYRAVRFDAKDIRHTDQFVHKFQQGALYRLYNDTWNGNKRYPGEDSRYFSAFRDHIDRVISHQRTHWKEASLSFFNADLKFWGASEILMSRWKSPKWTPEHLHSWERVQRLYYQVYNRIWPGHLSREIQERFLFFSNCIVLDRALEITTKVIDYCANEAMPNMKRFDTDENSLFRYLRDTSPYRNGTYYGYSNLATIENRAISPEAWIRPRLVIPEKRRSTATDVDYRVYRASKREPVRTDYNAYGPGRFNFYAWLTRIFEDIFAFEFGAQSDSWFAAVQAFIANPNDDIALYPDLGLLYAAKFPFVCHFPESLNCSIGAGLETALLWCTVGFIGVILIGAYVFPLITLPFQIIGFGAAYGLIFLAVAFHFPPACLIMTPSFPLGFGVALPQCIMDELIAFADKWITSCYSPLIIPPYMIAGELCPLDPMQRIDVLNCRDIGVSDGLQNMLYLGFWIFGSGFCDIMIQLAGSVFGAIIPGLQDYMVLTLTDFKNASPTQMERLTFCFFATLPTVVTPIIILFVAGLIIFALATPLTLLANSLLALVLASPSAGAVPGGDDSQWYGEEPEKAQPVERRRAMRGSVTPMGAPVSWMSRLMNLHGKKEKKE